MIIDLERERLRVARQLLAWSAALEHEHITHAKFVEREEDEEEPERRQTRDV
jgi:hypothetical protein